MHDSNLTSTSTSSCASWCLPWEPSLGRYGTKVDARTSLWHSAFWLGSARSLRTSGEAV